MKLDDMSADELREMLVAAREELRARGESALTADQERRIAGLPKEARGIATWLVNSSSKTLFWVSAAVAALLSVSGVHDCGPTMKTTGRMGVRIVHEIKHPEAIDERPLEQTSPGMESIESQRARARRIWGE